MNSTARHYGRWALPAIALVALLLAQALGGCAPDQASATPTPTKTSRPASTQAPVATPTSIALIAAATAVPPTAEPTQTPAPTEAPTASPTVEPSATPEPPTPTTAPEPPTTAPKPAAPPPTARPVQPTAAPPPPADACAGIGGDGCKWRVTGGPAFGENGGLELKLQFIFLHSGIDGGQPQGSYFVVLEKDGQKLPISDSVRSIGLTSSPGSLGKYNYEYVLGVDKLPGNTLAGHYRLWVLDGNGERDSQNLEFDLGATNGLIWIQFDQG